MSPIQQMLLGASGAEETYWIRELSSASNTTSSENAQKYKFASARLGADGKTLFAMYNTWFQRSGDNYWLPSVYNVKLNLKGDLQHFRRFYFNNYPYTGNYAAISTVDNNGGVMLGPSNNWNTSNGVVFSGRTSNASMRVIWFGDFSQTWQAQGHNWYASYDYPPYGNVGNLGLSYGKAVFYNGTYTNNASWVASVQDDQASNNTQIIVKGYLKSQYFSSAYFSFKIFNARAAQIEQVGTPTDRDHVVSLQGQVKTGEYDSFTMIRYNNGGTFQGGARMFASSNNLKALGKTHMYRRPSNGKLLVNHSIQSSSGWHAYLYELNDDLSLNKIRFMKIGRLSNQYGDLYTRADLGEVCEDSDGVIYWAFKAYRQQGSDSWTMKTDNNRSYYPHLAKLTDTGSGWNVSWVRAFIFTDGGGSLTSNSFGSNAEDMGLSVDVDDTSIYFSCAAYGNANHSHKSLICKLTKDGAWTGTYTSNDNSYKYHIRDVGASSSEHSDNRVDISNFGGSYSYNTYNSSQLSSLVGNTTTTSSTPAINTLTSGFTNVTESSWGGSTSLVDKTPP